MLVKWKQQNECYVRYGKRCLKLQNMKKDASGYKI